MRKTTALMTHGGHGWARRPAEAALVALVLTLGGCKPGTGATDGPWFEEIAAAAGVDFVHDSGHRTVRYMPEMTTGGGALFDMDGDGDLDIYLVQGGEIQAGPAERPPNKLYRNLGQARFEPVDDAGADVRGMGQGVAVGDYDNDADLDLYVANLGPDVLLQNDGGGRFKDVSAAAGVGHDGWGTSATFLDYDRDGWLDLFVCQYLDWSPEKEITCLNNFGTPDYCSPLNYGAPARSLLLRNLGDGRFEDRTEAAGMTAFGTALGVVTGDFNADGWQDVFVANDGIANRLWLNRGGVRFDEEALSYSCAIDNDAAAKAGMGTAAEDVDGDDDLDLLVCNLVNETDSFFENQDGAYFIDRTRERGLYGSASRTFTRFGVGMLDFDNDGLLDIYQANGRVKAEETTWSQDPYAEPNVLFRGLADGGFAEQLPRGGTADAVIFQSRAAIFGDIDNDGAVDVLVVNRDGPVSLLRNRIGARRSWIMFRVLDEHGRDALGATLRLQAGDRKVRRDVRSGYSYLAANDLRVHVGLASQGMARQVEVQWVDGRRERFGDFEARQLVTLRRGEGQEPAAQVNP